LIVSAKPEAGIRKHVSAISDSAILFIDASSSATIAGDIASLRYAIIVATRSTPERNFEAICAP
jgi:hypothetical protein